MYLISLLVLCIVVTVSNGATRRYPELDADMNNSVLSPILRATQQKEVEEPLDRQQLIPEDSSNSCVCVPYYQCNENGTMNVDGVGIFETRLPSEDLCDKDFHVCCLVANIYDNSTCGRRNFNGVSRPKGPVGKNNEAQYGEFPWVVAITKKEELSPGKTRDNFTCVGSLIHPQVVLTAAHWVIRQTDLDVRAGEWDTQTKSEPLPTQTKAVEQIIIHEDFSMGSLRNNIALLILKTPVVPAENVATICLPEQGEVMDNSLCVVSGWGKDVFGDQGKYQVILQKVELPIVPRSSCQESLRATRLGKNFKLHNSFICAGGQPGKDVCQGYGGSPLACPNPKDPNTYVQGGIVSWGVGCGSETPGVYTNVANFRNWIDDKLASLNL